MTSTTPKGVMFNPEYSVDFWGTPNEERSPEELAKFWDVPFIESKEWQGKTLYDVHCLDGGAWDRPTWYGQSENLEEAEEIALKLSPNAYPSFDQNF